MRFRSAVIVIAVIAVMQVAVALAVWRLTVGSSAPPSRAVRAEPRPPVAMERVAELLAASAFRALITADYTALNEVVRRPASWPEVAFVSIEDPSGKVIAHTDPARVGRAATGVTAEPGGLREVMAPMSGGGRTPSTLGHVRLGYTGSAPTPVPAPVPAPSAPPLAAILALVAIAAVPVGLAVLKLAGRSGGGPLEAAPDLRHIKTLKQAKWAVARSMRDAETARSQLDDRLAEIERLKEEVAIRTREVTARETAAGELRQEVAQQVAQHVARLQERETEVARLRQDLDLANGRFQDREAERARLEEALAARGDELTEQEAEIGRQDEALAAAAAEVAQRDEALAAAAARLQERDADVARLEETLARHASRLAGSEAEVGRLKEDITAHGAHLSAARAEAKERAAEIEQLTGGFKVERDQFAEELTRLSAQLIRANRDVEALETDLAQVRRDLEAAQEAAEAPPPIPRELIEEELKQLHSRAIAGISYAVRGSLTSVLGFSKLLLREGEGPLSEPQQTAVLNIYRSGDQLLSLVNDLVDLARVDAKMLDLQEETIDVPTLVREVAVARAESLRRMPADISVECAPDLPAVKADRRRLKQILLTLIQEPPQNGAVALDARPRGESIVIRLAHPGTTISANAIATLFDPFGPFEPSSPFEEDGGRLRLALARSLATLSGGDLTVESDIETGTTFVLTLPAAQALP